MRVMCSLVASLVLTVGPAHAQTPSSRTESSATGTTVLLNAAEIAAVRGETKRFASVIKRCDAEINHRAQPIAVLNSRRRYTATGTQNIGDGKILAADAEISYRAGVCYLVTQDARYAANAQRIIDAWAGTLTGVANHQSQGNINFKLPFMIAAASWVRGVNGWDSSSFDQFLVKTVLPESQSYNDNNHGMWGVFMEASGAAYLGDDQRLAKARARWGQILRGATSPDGVLVREILRSNTANFRDGPDKGVRGITYTHFFMLPSSMSAKIFADRGQPVWESKDGKLFGAAFKRAASFTLRPETFPYYASNGGKLNQTRGVSYFPLLLKFYENPDAEAVLRQDDMGPNPFFLPALFG